MGFRYPYKQQVGKVVGYVLYDLDLEGKSAKQLWRAYTRHLCGERELRNVLMAYAATHLSNWNDASEPGYDNYCCRESCLAFEMSLFDQSPAPGKFDMHDPWETENDRAES